MFGLINNLCKRYKIFSCNTVSSQCYADYFSGGVTNVNGAALTFVTPPEKYSVYYECQRR
jgi:hypothetical protein